MCNCTWCQPPTKQMKKQVNLCSLHFFNIWYMNVCVYSLLIAQCTYWRGSCQYTDDEDNVACAWIHSSRTMAVHTKLCFECIFKISPQFTQASSFKVGNKCIPRSIVNPTLFTTHLLLGICCVWLWSSLKSMEKRFLSASASFASGLSPSRSSVLCPPCRQTSYIPANTFQKTDCGKGVMCLISYSECGMSSTVLFRLLLFIL